MSLVYFSYSGVYLDLGRLKCLVIYTYGCVVKDTISPFVRQATLGGCLRQVVASPRGACQVCRMGGLASFAATWEMMLVMRMVKVMMTALWPADREVGAPNVALGRSAGSLRATFASARRRHA